MFAAKRHLDDTLLVRRYLADRGLAALEAGDEGALRHLAHCPACDARYQGLKAAFDGAREAALAEADAACTAGRLEHQRERIMRRIEALQAGPRVLPFPAAQSGQAASPPRVLRRWVAAAAVAGLLVGLGAGRMVFNRSAATLADARRGFAPGAAVASVRQTPTMTSVHLEPALNDEEFLSELELATAAPRTRELRALYAFTLEEPREVSRAAGKD